MSNIINFGKRYQTEIEIEMTIVAQFCRSFAALIRSICYINFRSLFFISLTRGNPTGSNKNRLFSNHPCNYDLFIEL